MLKFVFVQPNMKKLSSRSYVKGRRWRLRTGKHLHMSAGGAVSNASKSVTIRIHFRFFPTALFTFFAFWRHERFRSVRWAEIVDPFTRLFGDALDARGCYALTKWILLSRSNYFIFYFPWWFYLYKCMKKNYASPEYFIYFHESFTILSFLIFISIEDFITCLRQIYNILLKKIYKKAMLITNIIWHNQTKSNIIPDCVSKSFDIPRTRKSIVADNWH